MDLLQKEPGGPFKGWDPALLSKPLLYSQNNQVGGGCSRVLVPVWSEIEQLKNNGEFMKDYLAASYVV